MRFCYSVNEVLNPESLGGPDPLLAWIEVDPLAGAEALKAGLRPWVVERLRALGRDFGLYLADFSLWHDDDAMEYCVRDLCLVWSGTDVVTEHGEDVVVPTEHLATVLRERASAH